MAELRVNSAAMAASAALQALGARKADAFTALATGLRIATASDNAAYWSIATTMRSDVKAYGAVLDSLGLAAAKVDTAFSSIDRARAVLDEIKAKLVLAHEPAADKTKIQTEIRQLARQAVSIAESATFGGVNLLSTDVRDLLEAEAADRSTAFLAGMSRTSGGNLAFTSADVDLRETSLLNTDGGGILQRDPRSPGVIGNIRRRETVNGVTELTNYNTIDPSNARIDIPFPGPISFTSPGAQISFTLTIDEENPAHGLPAPLLPGRTSTIVIDRATVDAVLPGAGGVIPDYEAFRSVLGSVLPGTGASAAFFVDSRGQQIPDRVALMSNGTSGLNGSFVRVTDYASTVGPTGMSGSFDAGVRGSTIVLRFEPFKIYKDVAVDFTFGVRGGLTRTARIDRELVDRVLGTTDGRVATTAQMRAVLEELIADPALEITHTADDITVASRPEFDRRAGAKSGIGFTGVVVNIEPIPLLGVLDIDVAAHPGEVGKYLRAVDTMLQRAAQGATTLGAVKARIVSNQGLVRDIAQASERGIGQLVDADMEAASTRLKALQVQEQVAQQALSIANAAPSAFLRLFKPS